MSPRPRWGGRAAVLRWNASRLAGAHDPNPRAGDLGSLEWFGLFAADRGIIRNTYEAQVAADAIMLVVEAGVRRFGQIWIDLKRRDVDATAVLWALRVFPCLAEPGDRHAADALRRHISRRSGFAAAELSVDRSNLRAKRLYERLGYRHRAHQPVRRPDQRRSCAGPHPAGADPDAQDLAPRPAWPARPRPERLDPGRANN